MAAPRRTLESTKASLVLAFVQSVQVAWAYAASGGLARPAVD
jgi:hypothetical protein